MNFFLSLVRRFQADERGAFLATFGLLAVVLIATAGAAVDYTSVEQARTRAQVALDAAALALQPKIYEWTTEEIRSAAEDLMLERIGDSSINAGVDSAVADTASGTLRLVANMDVPMNFVSLVGVSKMDVQVQAVSARGSTDIEVAIALDITGSMAGSKIEALRDATGELIDLVVKDVQEPTYSKMALIPYSNGVNLGGYADEARGPATGYTDITNAGWLEPGSDNVISAISKANPARITTTNDHGLRTGDTVYISNIEGGDFTDLNDDAYTVTVVNDRRFTLVGASTNGFRGRYSRDSGVITTGTKRAIAEISRQNPGRVTTAVSHGLNTGDAVYITDVRGGNFDRLNDEAFEVTRISDTQFSLNGRSTSSYGNHSDGTGFVQKCQTSTCEVLVRSANHGLSNGENVYITNVNGMTQLNNQVFEVSDATNDTYVLRGSMGASSSEYTSGGRSYCTRPGCEYHYFESANRRYNLWEISTCVTSRVGGHQADDAPPSTAYVGMHYPPPSRGSLGACPPLEVLPLTDDKDDLHDLAEDLDTTGSTAGQIGLAWAWYTLSPNFAYIWPANNRPDDPDTNRNLLKVIILMTDGAFNTAYCDGVTSRNYGVVGSSESINCDATNGNPFDQAEDLCDAIKDDEIIIYTVAFDIGRDRTAIDFMQGCATDEAHAYEADDADDLSDAFRDIGNNISALRLIQ